MAHGRLGIANGKIIFYPPEAGGQVPTIAPGVNVKVKVNGVNIESPVPIGPQDIVEILPNTVQGKIKYQVDVSSDGLEAYILWHKKPGAIVEVSDAVPQRHLQPRGVVREKAHPPDPSAEDIIAVLKDAGVEYGIELERIQRLVRGELKGRQRVAVGTPSIPGKDAWIELCFNQEVSPGHETESGRVDYFERAEVVRVKAGDTLAILHPAQDGVPGKTVTGVPIEPPAVTQLSVRLLEGTELSSDNSRVMATKSGRPLFSNNEFRVADVLDINGNVDIKSGNVRYKGEVVVRGDVEENLLVQARGAVVVYGNVARARVDSQTSVRVAGQVVAAQITVSSYNEAISRLEDSALKLAEQLSSVSTVAQQIAGRLSQQNKGVAPLGPVLMFLLNKKFSDVLAHIETFHQLSRTEALAYVLNDTEAHETLDALSRQNLSQMTNPAELTELIHSLAELAQSWQSFRQKSGHFIGGYAQRAKITVSGSAYFQGHGAYQTDVQAGEFVVVQGLFRGGTIKAGKGVYLKEAGSPGEVETVINLGGKAFLRAATLHPGVRVHIGNQMWKAARTWQNVEVRISKNGSIEAIGLRSWNPPLPPR